MKIRKGRNRIVLVLPSIGIAIKLPIIHLLIAIRQIMRDLWRLNFKQIRRDMAITIDCSGYIAYRNFMLGGIAANWREFIFFYKTKNIFLQPTYFSLFGLVNIQKHGKLCTMKWRTFTNQIRKITNNEIGYAEHHFTNPKNFCFHKGHLRILDYGSLDTQRVIVTHGVKIFESFLQK